jgi:hypothetical protein
MTKAITQLNAAVQLTAPAAGDILPITDVSDTTEDPNGTTKPIAFGRVAGALRTGSLTAVAATLDALATTDIMEVTDVSDTSESASGTIKKATLAILASFWNIPVTPQMFGAKGDYVPATNTGTNDRVALQAFFDYLTTNGGVGNLGNSKYLWTISGGVGIQIGTNPDTPTSPPFRIIGGGMSLDNATGCSITLVGTCTSAISVNDSVYRGGYIGGFSVLCKANLSDNVYVEPANEAGIPVTNGLLFNNLYFTGLQFADLRFDNVSRCLVYLGTTYAGNGEFTTYNRVVGGLTRFLFMATVTGQSFNHRFLDCFGGGRHKSYNTSGFVAFELGGGAGGFNIDVINFNGTCTMDATSTTGLTIETLTRATLLKDNGSTGYINFRGGRNEHYSTIYWNAASNSVGCNVVIDGMDFAGMHSGTANPTIVTASDVTGRLVLRGCVGLSPVSSSDTRFDDAFIHIQLNGSKVNTLIENCAISGWNQTAARQQRMIVRAGSHVQSRLEFRNVIYDETGSFDNGYYIDQVITGSIPNHGEIPSLAFA